MAHTDEIAEAAALWFARTRAPAFADWAALTDWLEADPAHNAAYEAAFHADDRAAIARDHAMASGPSPAVPPAPRWGRRRIAGGVAAAAAALLIGIPLLRPDDGRYVVATRPGQHRAIRMADGSRLDLNGGTRVILDRNAVRTVRVALGEATFTVVHDDAAPFLVLVGKIVAKDVGTTFNVVRTANATTIAVREGRVLYDPAGAAIALTAGNRLHKADASPVPAVGRVDPATIASWRSGRLLYRDTSYTMIADDLSRALGEPVTIDPAIADRTFSGGIAIRGVEHRRLFRQLAALLDIGARHDADGWHLISRSRATH